MSVRKKFENQKIDVDALIEKGAKVKEDQMTESKKWAYMNLRIPAKMLNDVDDSVNKRVGISRTGWILEAIYEKLKKELNESA